MIVEILVIAIGVALGCVIYSKFKGYLSFEKVWPLLAIAAVAGWKLGTSLYKWLKTPLPVPARKNSDRIDRS